MNKRKSGSDVPMWIATFICFACGLWPIGVFLILRKLMPYLKDKNRNKSFTADENDTASRFLRYIRVVSGNEFMEIQHIASAVGVSYETALREIRQMVSRGDFGPDAYINYLTKTLVLRASGRVRAEAPAAAEKKAYAPRRAAKRASPKAKNTAPLTFVGVLMILLGLFLGFLTVGMAYEGGAAFAALIWFAITSLCSIVGGIVAMSAKGRSKKKLRRYKKYVAVVGECRLISLDDLAGAAGVPENTVVRDLEDMIELGYFPKSAYVDIGLGSLVISPEARPEYKEPEPEQPPENQYASIIQQIRTLNDRIADESVSARIYDIEDVTTKIFRTVEEKPEKLPQIKSFMSYYLPTTLKLLDSYATFENQGITGENIDSARRDIERILDTLVKGFRQQLDQLYSSDVLDISSDIDVLEAMMKKDGLAGNDFQTSVG